MTVSAENRLRYRAVLIGREVKALLLAPPERLARALARRWLLGPVLRWLFLGPGGKPHRGAEIVLADLRDFAHARLGLSPFDADPVKMARRVGRRETFDRLIYFLQLDELEVQAMMQVDDGLGGDGL